MTKSDMADKIETLIKNEAERKRLSENLFNEKTGNEEELEKIYSIING